MRTSDHEVEDQRVRVTVSIDQEHVRVAEPIELKVEVVAPDAFSISFLDFRQATILGDFEILCHQIIGPIPIIESERDTPDRYRKTILVHLESLRSGEREMAAISIGVTGATVEVTLATDPLRLTIESVVPGDHDPTHFRELKPAATPPPASDVSRRQWWWFPAFAFCVLAVLLALRRYRNSDTRLQRRWISGIDQIENAHTDPSGQSISASAHGEVCDWVKQWIQWKDHLPATSLVTDQLIDQLRQRSWPDPVLERLSIMLNRNDQMKFSPAEAMAKSSLIENEETDCIFDEARWLMKQPTHPVGDAR